jgi:4-diphosphocytidyl-2C-methyl-D-erythritol kinase
MDSLTIKSHAKVNVGLQIRNRRSDGFHNIHTIFQELELHDTISLRLQDSGCNFTSNVSWLRNDASNLCVRAWEHLSKYYDIGGISIDLAKNIPAGSGLGGGSSNAASVIKGLVKLYKIDISDKELHSIAISLGADVSFFLNGGLQQGDGVGEKLTRLPGVINGVYLLIIPNFHISTDWAYKSYKNFLDEGRDQVNFAGFLNRDIVPFEFFENDFESIVVPAYPEMEK